MPDEIEPALTPKEWRLVQLRIAGKMPGGYVRGWVVAGLPDEHHHAAMAVANAILPDGDPRKITREHLQSVQLLLDVSDDYAGRGPDVLADGDSGRANALLAALAALLPPNT